MTNVEVRVRSSYSALSPTCQKAADYLLAHTRELYSIPIAEFAPEDAASNIQAIRRKLGGLGAALQGDRLHRVEGHAPAALPAIQR